VQSQRLAEARQIAKLSDSDITELAERATAERRTLTRREALDAARERDPEAFKPRPPAPERRARPPVCVRFDRVRASRRSTVNGEHRMSAIDDVIGALGDVVGKLEEAATGAQAAQTETEEALGTAVALGANAAIEGMSAVKGQVETLLGLLTGAREGADEALATAKAVADST
jgi:hypothetical protein